jgi:hypothetical protein
MRTAAKPVNWLGFRRARRLVRTRRSLVPRVRTRVRSLPSGKRAPRRVSVAETGSVTVTPPVAGRPARPVVNRLSSGSTHGAAVGTGIAPTWITSAPASQATAVPSARISVPSPTGQCAVGLLAVLVTLQRVFVSAMETTWAGPAVSVALASRPARNVAGTEPATRKASVSATCLLREATSLATSAHPVQTGSTRPFA